MFRALPSSRPRAIDPGSRSPYVATCPKQSNGTAAEDADRKESVASAGGKLLGADRRRGSGGPVRRSSGRQQRRAVAWDIEIGPEVTGFRPGRFGTRVRGPSGSRKTLQ